MSLSSSAAPGRPSAQDNVTFHNQQRSGAGQNDTKAGSAKSDINISINIHSDNPLASTTVHTNRTGLGGAASGVQESVSPVAASDFSAPGRESTPVKEDDFSKVGSAAHKVGVNVFNVKGTSTGAALLVGKSDIDALRLMRSALATFKWDETGLIVSTPEYSNFHYQLEGLAQADQRLYKIVRDELYRLAAVDHHRFERVVPVPPAVPFEVPNPVEVTPLEIEAPSPPVQSTRHSNPCATIVGALVTLAGIVQLGLAGEDPDLEQPVPQTLQFVAGGLIAAIGLGTLAYQYKQSRD